MRKAFVFVMLCVVSVFIGGCFGNGPILGTVTTTTTAVPAAPTALAATASGTQVALTWTASSGATTYSVYYSTTAGFSTTSGIRIGSLTATSYTLTGLTSGTTYYFLVTATNAGGESAASTGASATTPVAVPAAPTGVAAASGNAQVTVTFSASTGATSYNLYYSLTSGVTAANGTKISGVTSPYTQTGLTNGTAYYYVVTAVNAGGESAASTQATATPLPPLPAAPTALAAVSGNAQVALSWSGSSGATSYNVYYGTTAGAAAVGSGTKVGAISGTSYTVTGLTNGTLYYFVVSAVNLKGESTASSQVSATPTNGVTVALTPGTASSATLQANATTSLTFNFPGAALNQAAVATISPVTLAGLSVPLPSVQRAAAARVAMEAGGPQPESVHSTDTFAGAFNLQLNLPAVTQFNVPVTLSGSVGTAYAVNSSVVLAFLVNNQWVDVATFVVDAKGGITENLASFALAGLLSPGSYLLYQPLAGNNTAVSNLGVALVADDGARMKDGSNGLQVIHIYDAAGNILSTPTIAYLDYANASDLDGQALTPDGSQGIMVDGGNTLRFFSNVQTGTPVASTTTLSVSAYGADGDSVAILPNGDEAVVSADASGSLLLVSGILAGVPVAGTTIAVPSNRDALVLSNDGKVMLARGGAGLTVFGIASITPIKGSAGGMVSHSFTQQKDFPALGTNFYFEDGRSGMALSPADSSRAVIVTDSASAGTIQLMTGLTTSSPVAGATVALPAGSHPRAVAVSQDGKLAVVGGYGASAGGMLLYSGVDTGTLTLVGAAYAPTFQLGTSTVTMGQIKTLGITLDNKYVIAGDSTNSAVEVVAFSAAGFAAAPASALGSVAIPNNDQLLVH